MNQLLSASATPDSIKNAGTTRIAIKCEVEDDGSMIITGTDGFDLSPQSRDLSAGQLRADFDLKITRNGAKTPTCDLTFTFRGSAQPTTVTVK